MTKKRRKTTFKPFKNEYQIPITTDFSSTHKFATFVPKGLIIIKLPVRTVYACLRMLL